MRLVFMIAPVAVVAGWAAIGSAVLLWRRVRSERPGGQALRPYSAMEYYWPPAALRWLDEVAARLATSPQHLPELRLARLSKRLHIAFFILVALMVAVVFIP